MPSAADSGMAQIDEASPVALSPAITLGVRLGPLAT
jgi:hypothetical protein